MEILKSDRAKIEILRCLAKEESFVNDLRKKVGFVNYTSFKRSILFLSRLGLVSIKEHQRGRRKYNRVSITKLGLKALDFLESSGSVGVKKTSSRKKNASKESNPSTNQDTNITILGRREHQKASEVYLDVIFKYPQSDETWEGSVPIEYRRTGTCARTSKEIDEVVKRAHDAMNPEKRENWLRKQEEFWQQSNKKVTQSFFDGLKDSKLKCVNCQLPKNPNWARRIQDIKELGYTLATDTKKFCGRCKRKTTHLILLRLPRGVQTGYESWSLTLRQRILKVLKYHDAYENRQNKHLLPDHKFPEIRWDESTREEISDEMTDEEIKRKFQLLTNQRNEQKREVCRRCFQTGRRGTPFGINFFYKGDERWPKEVPKVGKAAEKGCVGCGWYDLDHWRLELNKLQK